MKDVHCLIEYHDMKTYWVNGDVAFPILTSAVDGGESLGSCPGRFNCGKITSFTHWIGGWVSPRDGLETVVRRKSFITCQKLNPGRPVRSLVTILTDLPLIPSCLNRLHRATASNNVAPSVI